HGGGVAPRRRFCRCAQSRLAAGSRRALDAVIPCRDPQTPPQRDGRAAGVLQPVAEGAGSFARFHRPSAWRLACNHFKCWREENRPLGRMRKIVTPVILLLVAIVHAPLTAQARFFELWPAGFPPTEPVVLFLTGIALLGRGRFGSHRGRSCDDRINIPEAPPRPATSSVRSDEPAAIKRAA